MSYYVSQTRQVHFISVMAGDNYADVYATGRGGQYDAIRVFNPYNAIAQLAVWEGQNPETRGWKPRFTKEEWDAIQRAKAGVTQVSKLIAHRIGWK